MEKRGKQRLMKVVEILENNSKLWKLWKIIEKEL